MMKFGKIITFITIQIFALSLTACGAMSNNSELESTESFAVESSQISTFESAEGKQIRLITDNTEVTVTLNASKAAADLVEMLPLELTLIERNEFAKGMGIAIFALFVVHHILNGKWSRSIHKGKYTPLRVLQTALVVLVLLSILGSMISGIILSRHALAFLPINGGQAFARTLHMLSAYWGFVLMSIHLGLHWSIILNIANKAFKKPSAARNWMLRIIAFAISGYGVYAFIRRGIGSYMLLKNQFVFFDFDEPMIFFLDYLAIMMLFAAVGHYMSLIVKRLSKQAVKTQNE